MIKPFFKTLSFSFVTLATAAVSIAAEQNSILVSRAASPEWTKAPRSQVAVEIGWERQQKQLEERLAARSAVSGVPGAIIVSPFPDFAPYRNDVPGPVAKNGKASKQKVASRR